MSADISSTHLAVSRWNDDVGVTPITFVICSNVRDNSKSVSQSGGPVLSGRRIAWMLAGSPANIPDMLERTYIEDCVTALG